jgi:hypothetical protein
MQLGVREKKNVCKSTSPEKSSLGPCSIQQQQEQQQQQQQQQQ